jgi:hypothetical protein
MNQDFVSAPRPARHALHASGPNIRPLQAAAVVGLALIVGLGAPPANAQFVCDNDLGGEFGEGATAAGGANNVACGTGANASGANSGNTAFGRNAIAVGDGSGNTASGNTANASGNSGNNTASGTLANASGNSSSNTASGFGAVASGINSTNAAFGRTANALGDGSSNTASGTLANASGDGSRNVAIGNNALATGDGTTNTAVGASSRAQFANSAAFGADATTTRANQQVFGTAANTYTMAGIASAASAAAQTGPRQIVTSDAAGNLATSSLAGLGLASAGDIAGINSRLDDLSSRSGKAYAGIAMAFAMAGAPTVLPNETFVTTLNWGTFQGSHGFAVSSAYRIGTNMQLNGGIAMSPNQNLIAGRAGVRFGW